MKVLSIGNSFTQDSHYWLKPLAAANGVEMELLNLYIGGCSLAEHWAAFSANEARHLLRRNGELAADAAAAGNYITISDGLDLDVFDVVTIHQAGSCCGAEESWEPYITDFLALIRAHQPQAAIWIMEPWAYEVGFDQQDFERYGRDQERMCREISEVCRRMSQRLNVPLIPVGTAIQRIRETVPGFDYQNGGLSLCRDGRHLSKDYGRLVAAAVWFRALTGQDVRISHFEAFDMQLVEPILAVVNSV